MPKRERVWKDSRRVEEMLIFWEKRETLYFWGGGGRKGILLESAQAVPARLSDENMRV
jgi:hypothetical protein